MALTGTAMNAITVCLPSLVMALSVLDLVHLIAAIDALPDDVDRRRTTPASARPSPEVVTPGLFNILTTAIGLLALVTATSAVTRQLGAFAALGVALAWLFCLLWTAIALPRALRRRRVALVVARQSHDPHHPPRPLRGRPSEGRPHRTALAMGVIGGTVGIARLDVDTDTLGFLPATHPVHQDVRAVEASVGPFIPLEVDIAVDAPGAWQQARVIAGLRPGHGDATGSTR
jgi:uncharacterized protein